MKQLAVHRLGWAAGLIAFIQLPMLASSSVSDVAPSPDRQTDLRSPQVLVAVSLSRRSLSLGDEGDDVIALQRFLSRQSLYPFIIDGVYGSETADAVATYQRIRGFSATGVADESTLIDMDFDFAAQTQPLTPAASNVPSQATSLLAPSLSLNDSGTDVIALQQRLRDFGIPLFVDGVYGFETQQAVRTYQRVQNIEVTGNADSATLERMGFRTPNYPYIAAVIADAAVLSEVQKFFPNAYVDRNKRGRFINIGSFAERLPAEARVDAAAARGFTTRVLYSRSGLLGQ
ncbi:MAG: hypothetical protein DCF25_07000 [Leptolyngbya foveolarum]|uniref:Peptidoglycan binding-like domain-containing protein n=1 Tax=Leptolyngbya foveolarum TaxID=47253 RepID=A0A2W4UFX7_9CYAN|nr:MAG: hypothetical protein DCF25_07000 [Leptolyngbya foveolarum]